MARLNTVKDDTNGILKYYRKQTLVACKSIISDLARRFEPINYSLGRILSETSGMRRSHLSLFFVKIGDYE